MHKQKANVYTVMLVLALIALIVGCIYLYQVIETYGAHGEYFAPRASLEAIAPLHTILRV